VGLLAVATVPAAIVGVLARDLISSAFERPLFVSAFLVVTAAILWWSERRHSALGTLEPSVSASPVASRGPHLDATTSGAAADVQGFPWSGALAIGAAQALAVLPGISRSGATIAAGMALGLPRAAAARFSFLLLLPVTLGAALVTLPELASPPAGTLPFAIGHILLGVGVSATSGYLAIRVLIAFVSRHSLLVFARYVLVLATVLTVTALVRG
jgi:undecaprenyl-diphosphatase